MQVNIFKNSLASKPQVTELGKIVHMMCFSQELCHRTLSYRSKWIGKEKLQKVKLAQFPAFVPASFLVGGDNDYEVIGLTGLCFLDIDNLKEKKKMRFAMNILQSDKNVVMASKSVSGKGLHILIRYQLKDMQELPRCDDMTEEEMQNLYNKIYDHYAIKYILSLELEADTMANHIDHKFVISYDPFMYYNPDAEPDIIELSEGVSYEVSKPLLEKINAKLNTADALFALNQKYRVEKTLKETGKLLIKVIPLTDKVAVNEIGKKIPVIENDIDKIFQTKEKIAKAYNILARVEENLANRDFDAARENIAESNRALRGVKKPYKGMIEKVRKDICVVSKKVTEAYREIKMETQRQKFLLRGLVKQGDYKQAILHIIEQIEAIQKSYDAGDLRDCKEKLMIINVGLGILPNDDNKAVLEAHYEKWKKIVNDAKISAVGNGINLIKNFCGG